MRNAASIWRPTACVQVMRPGTCALHRIRSDGRPRGGSKELRQHGRRRFCQVDWHEMFHSFRHRSARCVARLRPLLPVALLVVDCYSVSASVRVYPLFRGGGAPRGWCAWGLLHVHVTPPRCFPLARWPRAHVPLPEASGALQVCAAPPVASLRVATLLPAPLWSAAPVSPPCSPGKAG